MHWCWGIGNPPLGNIGHGTISLKWGVAITTLIAGKEITMMNGHLVVAESLIVVVNNPPLFASTQVKNVPHLGHLGPMTSARELIALRENSEHNCSCTLLFLRVSKDKMLGDGIMERAHLLKGRVDSVVDHCIRVSTRVGSLACCNQNSLPILKLWDTNKGGAWEACDSMRDKDFHHDLVVLEPLNRQVQGVYGTLQSCLKVNTNQVAKESFNVHLNEWPNMALDKLFSEASIITPHGTTLSKHRSTRIFKEAHAVIIIDPLGEGNCSYPISMPPWHFHNPMRALEMKGIPLAGQNIDRMQQVLCWETTCGLDSQQWASMNDLVLQSPSPTIPQWFAQASEEDRSLGLQGWPIGYMLSYQGKSGGSLEKHESQCPQTAAPDHSSPRQIATTPLRREEIPSPWGSQRREPNCSNRKRLEPECYQLTCCLHRWRTCEVSHRQQGRVQYWHFCRRGQVTDPTGGLMVSALLSGGSSPGGAEIPEGAEDPVPVDSCFCVGIIRIVS